MRRAAMKGAGALMLALVTHPGGAAAAAPEYDCMEEYRACAVRAALRGDPDGLTECQVRYASCAMQQAAGL